MTGMIGGLDHTTAAARSACTSRGAGRNRGPSRHTASTTKPSYQPVEATWTDGDILCYGDRSHARLQSLHQ